MASKNTSIALGAPYTDFARRKVESGEYGSTSEVVREAMRQFMHEDMRIVALRTMSEARRRTDPPASTAGSSSTHGGRVWKMLSGANAPRSAASTIVQ